VFIAFVAAQSALGCCSTEWKWLAALRGVAVAGVMALLWRHYTELRAPRLPAREWILAVGVGIAVFLAWIHLDRPFIAFESGPGFDPRGPDGRIDVGMAGLRLFGLVAVVPLAEELFWRSFLMRWIEARDFLGVDPSKVRRTAFVVCSALFALEHSMWLAGLLAGLAYGWVYIRSGNLWIPIVSHTTTNGLLGLWILATGSWRFW
jgi:CAAX prenyl protease-like protein